MNSLFKTITARPGRIKLGVISLLVVLAILATTITVALAVTDPVGVSFTLEGCKVENLPAGYDLEANDFICADSAYTTGNLGKEWNELDLVPHRVTTSAGNSAPTTQTYRIAVVADHFDSGHPGYDILSTPVLNVAKSDASCSISVGAEQVLDPGVGGTDKSLYRLLDITQAKNTTCVFDYYERLAVGSHLYPGASLHSNLLNQYLSTGGVGNKDVSIPVNEILPQELDKDMSATQDADHIWNITKAPSPASLSFANTCLVDPSARQQNVAITVEWEKLSASPSGDITVVTNVYATNPAHRTITVEVTDVIYSGETPLDSATSDPVPVPANTTQLVLTHTFDVPAGTTGLHDVATATYTDTVTGIPVPGQTIAEASAVVQPSGITLNQTAVINDVETISGIHLSFSANSFTPAIGGFDDGYVAGTGTIGPVSWTSFSQSGTTGSVTFNKTVYVIEPAITSGTLSDTAILTGSDGFTADAEANVAISASASVILTINKAITPALTSGSQAFTFHVFNASDNEVASTTITFNAGETSKSVNVNGLAPGTYKVTEETVTGYVAQDPRYESIFLPSCSGSVSFTNAKKGKIIVDKVTVPSGDLTEFEFDPSWSTTNFILADGTTPYDSGYLVPGPYSVAELAKAGWDLTSATCDDGSPVTNIEVSPGEVVTCTFTNTKRGHILVDKVTIPSGESQLFDFALTGGPSALDQTFQLADATAPYDSGAVLPGSGYSAAETTPAGWDLTSATCDDGSPVTNIEVSPGETITCTFTNTQRGKIIVEKQTIPDGATGSFTFTGDVAGTIGDGGQLFTDNVVPGTYTSVEGDPRSYFDLTSIVCDDANSSGDVATRTATFVVEAGETVKCTFTNTQRGNIVVVKNTIGGDGTFDFTSSTLGDGSFSLTTVGGTASTGTDFHNLVPGPFDVTETDPRPYFDLTNTSCVSSIGDAETADSLELDPGETITCTFTNTQRGHILVDKVTIPSGESQLFDFALTGGPSALDQTFQLADASAPYDSGAVLPGSGYSAVETTPAGWDLTSATCDDGSPVTNIAVSPGETITCTFTNTKRGKIIVEKQTIPDGATGSFTFTGDVAGTIGDGGQLITDNVVPGTYTSVEGDPTPYFDLTSIVCNDTNSSGDVATRTATFVVEAGETVKCTFTNTQRGKIIVEKQTIPDGSTVSFEFDPSYGVNFFLKDGEQNDSGWLVPGSYSVAEPAKAGWDLTNTACSDGSPVSAIDLAAGETVTCVFTNTQRGEVTLLKLTNGDATSTMAWNFTLTGPEVNETDSTPPTTVDFGGVKLIAGETYKLCEIGIPAGWTFEWKGDTDGDGVPDTIIPQVAGVNDDPVDPSLGYSRVFDPNYVPPPGEYTNDTRCVNFVVEPGATRAFTIDNQYPEGEQRTPGYWKNWNRCSKGNQQYTADANGGWEEGFWLLEDVIEHYYGGSIVWDGFQIDSCELAVSILDTRDFATGKKMASDPGYKLARNLLAAQLNIGAGACTTPEINKAVEDAITLLAQQGFDAVGPGIDKKDKSLAPLALQLADLLDDYNNGMICSSSP